MLNAPTDALRTSARWPRVRTRAAIAALLLFPITAAQPRIQAPDALSDAEFWNFFTNMSEPGGSFVSENFVSNEMEFQQVIPSLQRSLSPGGVYLGVGPEQNFTYIANLHPRMAVIFDIRRQNALQHLLYKAIFELSPTRADFVARLFSRPTVSRLGPDVKVSILFDSANAAPADSSAYRSNQEAILTTLTRKHRFALSSDDISTIETVYSVFREAGPAVNYASRSSSPAMIGGGYPNYGMLQTATGADSTPMAFLANEANYRTVRDLQLRNMIVPVVGDFAGPKAIRAVGDYLHRRRLTVSAFYLSNVEQYLFRQAGSAGNFYGNVASLPIDTTSAFIRSVPRQGGVGGTLFGFGGPAVIGGGTLNPPAGSLGSGGFSISITDVGGVRTTRTVRDSAGVQVVQVAVDSGGRTKTLTGDSARATTARQDSMYLSSLRAMIAARDSALRQLVGPVPGGPTRMVMMGGLLRSGVASMRETLDAFFANRLTTYEDVIRMTKTPN